MNFCSAFEMDTKHVAAEHCFAQGPFYMGKLKLKGVFDVPFMSTGHTGVTENFRMIQEFT